MQFSWKCLLTFSSTILGTKFCLRKRILEDIFFDEVLFCLHRNSLLLFIKHKLKKEKKMNPKEKHVSFWIYLFWWITEYSISKKYYLLKPKKVKICTFKKKDIIGNKMFYQTHFLFKKPYLCFTILVKLL